MESEKVKEIKKALECCSVSCTDCPYDKGETTNPICINNLTKNALTLINEFEKENDKLKQHKQELQGGQQDLVKTIKAQHERIAELEKEIEENAFYSKGYAQGIKNTYEVVIPDKLKQFAERLKDKLDEYRLKNEYLLKDEPNGNLWQLSESVFCIEVAQDGGLVDDTLKEFINE